MASQDKYLIVVVGPTAVGKTSTSIGLAKHFKTEIINADSRQVFAEMNIGTAKPTDEELSQAKHHLVGHKSIKERYSAGDFEREAIDLLSALFQYHDILIMTGGSGLYVDAVCNGLDDLPHDNEIRENLNKRLESEGIHVLQEQLKFLDPEHYNNMDIQNPQRLIRALEVCLATGKPYSEFRNNQKSKRPFRVIKVGLKAEREVVYDRINRRVDQMVDDGLIEEVRSLLPHKELNALNTVGYKELFEFFDSGTDDPSPYIEKIKMNTRRFAKRQFTWYRKDKDIHWFDHTATTEIIQFLENQISKASV